MTWSNPLRKQGDEHWPNSSQIFILLGGGFVLAWGGCAGTFYFGSFNSPIWLLSLVAALAFIFGAAGLIVGFVAFVFAVLSGIIAFFRSLSRNGNADDEDTN
jgi:hypothetical protein